MNPIPTHRTSTTAVIAACLSFAVFNAAAVDTVVLNNGQKREGEIVSVRGSNVSMKIGPVETNIPLADIASVSMDPPTAYETASQLLADGNHARALVEIRPVVERFGGLPTDWARRAFAIQGDALVELNQLDEAQRVFDALEAAYPGGDAAGSVSSARLDIARKDFSAAKLKLAPVITESQSVLLAEPSESARLGRAFLLMGQVQESEGDLPAALESYLKTITVFYDDTAAVNEARSRADVLINEKKVIAP